MTHTEKDTEKGDIRSRHGTGGAKEKHIEAMPLKDTKDVCGVSSTHGSVRVQKRCVFV